MQHVLEGQEQFYQWNEKQTHDKGTAITPDKALVRAMDKALESLLHNAAETVSPADIQHWIVNELRFKIHVDRIDEHCLYKAGESGTPRKAFPQPIKHPVLRIVRDGVYAVARDRPFYTYTTRSHSNK